MVGIFKNNDIRGHYGTNLTDEIAMKIGYLFGKRIGEGKNVVIGGDTRKSTPILKRNISNGLLKAGINVYDAGVGPTPMIYHISCTEDNISEGIIVTGSHNPADQNGIKICDDHGASYDYDNLFSHLETDVEKIDISEIMNLPNQGNVIDGIKFKEKYFDVLISSLKGYNTDLTIAIDCGGGATIEFVNCLKEAGFNVIPFGTESGELGLNPPDPTKPHTYQRLIETSKNDEIDLGIAFDTDGDRVGFITSSGYIIPTDKIIMLYGEKVLTDAPDARIIIDVKISKATSEFLTSKGADVVLTRVGHSYIHEKLLDIEATMAAELSGHFYFYDNYHGFDDGLYAAVRFIQIVSDFIGQEIDLDRRLSELPEYHSTKEFRDHISYERQERILRALEDYAKKENAKLIKIDGIRAEFPSGWFIARQSGTEEALSYRIEGIKEEDKDEILSTVKNIIENE